MSSITGYPNQLKLAGALLAVAALVIGLMAVVFSAGPAQATTAPPAPDDGAAQQAAPRHAAPEPCPGETGNPNKEAARVVDAGHIALFDVWWNPEELELTNTSCPPTVKHVPEEDDGAGSITPARDDRAASNIDIDKTIIHIPNSARVNLNAAGTPYPEKWYDDLWNADAKEDRNSATRSEDEDPVGDGFVWALPACPPDGTAAAGDLCIAFSAALLNPLDWANLNDNDGVKIEYLLDHVHQVDIDKQDPRYTLAYDIPKGGATSKLEPLWDSSDLQVAKMQVAPGEYRRPTLFFTSRGTYEFQVHIRGNPSHATNRSDGLKPVSKDDSVTSDMRTYIIHVGVEADLGVTATANPATPAPTESVAVKIIASNSGPETVPSASVDVTLPSELTYSSHAPAGATFADSDGDGTWTWKVGRLAPKASQTLTIQAKVASNTHGQELVVKAAVSGTETIEITETDDNAQREVKEYSVPVADPDPTNDTGVAAIKVTDSTNTAPMFFVTRSVPENSAAGTNVGDPVGAKDPDSGDTLTFSLTGEGSDKFTVSAVSGGAQIAVADNAFLDFEVKPTHELVLGVSDGKNAHGNADPSVDHTIEVLIKVEDVKEKSGLTVSASAQSLPKGQNVTITAILGDLPEGHGPLTYRWLERGSLYNDRTVYHGHTDPTLSTMMVGGSGPATLYFTAEVSWTQNGNTTTLQSNEVLITWTD